MGGHWRGPICRLVELGDIDDVACARKEGVQEECVHVWVGVSARVPEHDGVQVEVDGAADGDWQERAPEDVRAKIEAAQAAGATAVCETYFYIGNLPNQYSGGDVTLYDFVVMVETDLSSGRQTLLLSVPVEAVPARRVDVSVAADGSATMALDGGEDGLDVFRRLLDLAPAALEAGGMLCVELFEGSLEDAAALVRERDGWASVEIREDLTHRPRVLVARRALDKEE